MSFKKKSILSLSAILAAGFVTSFAKANDVQITFVNKDPANTMRIIKDGTSIIVATAGPHGQAVFPADPSSHYDVQASPPSAKGDFWQVCSIYSRSGLKTSTWNNGEPWAPGGDTGYSCLSNGN